ncbi:MAG: alpha/beta hydrolase [Candidatus Hermodarchaeota archaeon]
MNMNHKVELKEFTVKLGERGEIYGKMWYPNFQVTIRPIMLIWLHWTDSRGFSALNIYENFGKTFSQLGYPVVLFDQLGSGEKSTGRFEFPKEMADQFIEVTNHALGILKQNFVEKDFKWQVVALGHSLGGVTLMYAVEKGFPLVKSVFLSVPPSHGRSLRRYILQEHGRLLYLIFHLLARIDPLLGLLGIPLTTKLFGFTFRWKDVLKVFLRTHAARMAATHPELPVLAIFGDRDEYITQEDIEIELPEGKYSWIKRVIITNATHDMLAHQKEVFALIQDFLESL